jgi:hypothetical protein
LDLVAIGRAADGDQVQIKSSGGLQIFSSPAPQLGALVGTSGTIGTDASVELTPAQWLSGIVGGDPAGTTTALLLPTVAELIAALDAPEANDSFYVTIINQATTSADEPMTLTVNGDNTGADGVATLVGEMTVEAAAVSGEESSGSGLFLFRITDVDATPALSVYRIA